MTSTASIHADAGEDNAVPLANREDVLLFDLQFDGMVFGHERLIGQAISPPFFETIAHPTPDDFRNVMQRRVTAQIAEISETVKFTDAQKQKLQLAARGDIEQHIRRALELRPKITEAGLTQQQFDKLLQEASVLQVAHAGGIIVENSLYRKTLRKLITAEQQPRFDKFARQRTKLDLMEAHLFWEAQGKQGLTLVGETKTKFDQVILEYGHMPLKVGGYGSIIALLEADRLCERMKPLLTGVESNQFESLVGRAKWYVPLLERAGIWIAHPSDWNDDGTTDETEGDEP